MIRSPRKTPQRKGKSLERPPCKARRFKCTRCGDAKIAFTTGSLLGLCEGCVKCEYAGLTGLIWAVAGMQGDLPTQPPVDVWKLHGITDPEIMQRMHRALPLMLAAADVLGDARSPTDVRQAILLFQLVADEAVFISHVLPLRSTQFIANYLKTGSTIPPPEPKPKPTRRKRKVATP